MDKYKMRATMVYKRAKKDATCYIQSVQKCGAVKKGAIYEVFLVDNIQI